MTWTRQGASIAVTFVLAAILGPEQFGLVAMAIVYLSLLQLLLEQGMGAAIVQRRHLARCHLDTAFALNIVACAVLAVISALLAPWWARVNDAPVLTLVIQFLTLLILIQGLSVVHQALLTRRMQFRSLAIRDGASVITGGVIGIWLALSGYGVWALVGQQLSAALVALVLLWWLSDWRPGLALSVRAGKQLIVFSGGVLWARLGTFIASRSDTLLMGLFFDPTTVGLYRFGDRLINMVLDLTTRAISSIALPHFSRYQSDREQLHTQVRACIRLSALVAVPAMVALAVSITSLLDLLGERWLPSGIAVRILALMGIAKAATLVAGPLLRAMGHPYLQAGLVWLLACVSVGAFIPIAMALQDRQTEMQIAGLAWTRAGIFVGLYGLVNLLVVSRIARLRIGSIGRSLLPGFVVGAGALLMGALAASLASVASLSSIGSLFLIGGACGVSALSLVLILDADVRMFVARVCTRMGCPLFE